MSLSSPSRFLIACGGTGGHLFPGIAVAEELQRRGHHAKLLISQKKVDAEASKKYQGLDFVVMPAIGAPPLKSPKIIPYSWQLWKSIRSLRHQLQDWKIDAVLGMGGFTSLPPIYAAKGLGLPSFVHDSNALPGKANRLTARFCREVFIGLDAAKPYFSGRPVRLTGTPVRSELSHLPSRADAANRFQLDPQRPTALIMGGSQGAQKLNSLLVEASQSLASSSPWQFLHLAGSADAPRVQALLGNAPHHRILAFCDDMPAALACADLAICRAGASSLSELAFVGMPSILIPFPFAADDHQSFNANAFSQAGAAITIQERDLQAQQITEFLLSISQSPERLDPMRHAASQLAVRDAATQIVQAMESSLPS